MNYEEHDAFLKNIFNEATNRIVIISPWIIYSTIEKTDMINYCPVRMQKLPYIRMKNSILVLKINLISKEEGRV